MRNCRQEVVWAASGSSPSERVVADLEAVYSALCVTADRGSEQCLDGGSVANGSCMSALPASSAAAANRAAASRTVEEPFEDDHWVLDTGTHFDMCPTNIP